MAGQDKPVSVIARLLNPIVSESPSVTSRCWEDTPPAATAPTPATAIPRSESSGSNGSGASHRISSSGGDPGGAANWPGIPSTGGGTSGITLPSRNLGSGPPAADG